MIGHLRPGDASACVPPGQQRPFRPEAGACLLTLQQSCSVLAGAYLLHWRVLASRIECNAASPQFVHLLVASAWQLHTSKELKLAVASAEHSASKLF